MKMTPVSPPVFKKKAPVDASKPEDKNPALDPVAPPSTWAFDHFGSAELLKIDITFHDLLQGPWDFSRGARTVRKYFTMEGSVAIEDTYTYTMEADNRSVKSLARHIEWFNADGSVKVSKDISPTMTAKKLKSLNRDVRQGRIDYLESAAEAMRTMAPSYPEPYKTGMLQIAAGIDGMFEFFAAEVTAYIARGTTAFETAVAAADSTSPVFAILETIPDPARGWTVRESIIYQLNGTEPNVT